MTQRAFIFGANGPPWNTQLCYADKDAESLGACFRDACKYQVYPAPDGADAHDTMRELSRVAALCQPGDDLLIYFSGHGELLTGKLFLLLDTTSETVFNTAINTRHVLDALEFSPATNKLLILDCCHAGGAVGFKGGDLAPLLTESGGHLVLCASRRIEEARELAELKGSFLAHHTHEILHSEASAYVSLADLVGELRKRAEDHNASNPRSRVPIPSLFGEYRPFFVKRPGDRSPVRVAFRSLFEPDMAVLRHTLQGYRRWDVGHVLDALPVETVLPAEFTDRISTLSGYLKADTWPCVVDHATKSQVKYFIEHLIPSFSIDLSRAVRVMTAASMLPDGSSNEVARDAVLGSYIEAKTLATLRIVQALRLSNEPEPFWLDQFRELDKIWSNDLICGLTWTAQRNHKFNFWTDADWYIDDRSKVRIYVPQVVGRGEAELEGIVESDYWSLFLPQVLEKDQYNGTLYADIGRLVALGQTAGLKKILVRGETVIETETHNSGHSSYYSKSRATRMVAEALAAQLRALPPTERRREFFQIVPFGGILDELSDKVRKLLPELDVRGAGEVGSEVGINGATLAQGEISGQVENNNALGYLNTAEPDPSSVSKLRLSGGPFEVRYHQSIHDVWAILSEYDHRPDSYLSKIPFMQKLTDTKEREENAVHYYDHLHSIAVRVQKVMARNQSALETVINRLRVERAGDKLFDRSLSSFGRFAALHVIKALKSFYDLRDGKPIGFFEEFAFASASWAILECGDSPNPTGHHVFGVWYWLEAHVGREPDDYGHALLPIDLTRKIDAGEGDPFVIYCEWILPQIAFNDPDHVDRVSAQNWSILSLRGARSDGQTGYDGEWSDDGKRMYWG